jgi:hypothetical protein
MKDEFEGPISYLLWVFTPDPRHQKPPKPPPTPAEKALRRALYGAGFLAACLWLSPGVWRNLAVPLWHVSDPSLELWLPFGVWAFVTLAAAMSLYVGLMEAAGLVPANWMGAFWSISIMLGIAALWVKHILPAHEFDAYFVRGLYVSGLAVAAVYFFIASGLSAANARRVMLRQLRQRKVALQPARPRPARRWFFLWLW